MTPIPDPVAAIIAHLSADAAVASLVADRVFGIELPPSETDSMPRAAIVVRPAGGPGAFGGGYQQFGDIRVDVLCYGARPREAGSVWQAVHPALKQMERSRYDRTLLHWARPAGGPIPLRDPDTDWPFTTSAWQVLASERLAE